MKNTFAKVALVSAMAAFSASASADSVSYTIEAYKEQVISERFTMYSVKAKTAQALFWKHTAKTNIPETPYEDSRLIMEQIDTQGYLKSISHEGTETILRPDEIHSGIYVNIHPRMNKMGLLQSNLNVKQLDLVEIIKNDNGTETPVVKKYEIDKNVVLEDGRKTVLGELNGVTYYVTQKTIAE